MELLTFYEVMRCTGGTTTYLGPDFALEGFRFDSREDMQGKVFLAFVTEKDNGHHYISVAANKGAAAAIVSEDVDSSLPCIKVLDTKRAYQDIARHYRRKCRAAVIAVTGSSGKTTVKDMLFSILSTKYKVLSTLKNYNNELGVPYTILQMDDSYDIVIIEMGMNHKGELKLLSEIARPDMAVITNIGTSHMGNLGGTRDDVLHAKLEVLEGMQENALLILSGDDELLSETCFEKYRTIYSGFQNDGRNLFYVSEIKQTWEGADFGLSFQVFGENQTARCLLPVLGMHNVKNVLLALSAAALFQIPLEMGVKAVQIYPRSSMRLETSMHHGVKFIKDYYNTNIESFQAAMDTLHDLNCSGSRIAVLGDIPELGDFTIKEHAGMAEYTISRADIVYYIGDYCDVFRSARPDANCFSTKEQLNQALFDAARQKRIQAGDIILLKGSGGIRMWEHYEYLRTLLECGSAVSAQTRLLVDVDALKYNYAALKREVGDAVEIMPVIKADAYGGGLELVANVYSGCKYFAVADLQEADRLQKIMPNANILILYQQDDEYAPLLVERGYLATVCKMGPAGILNREAGKQGKKLRVHVKIDTGMSRFGADMKECAEYADFLSSCRHLVIDGIYTHYSSADLYTPEDMAYTKRQTALFQEAIAVFEERVGPIPYKHACASAAIFNENAERFNMVRPGISLYGYYPCEEMKSCITLRPYLKYVTRVTQVTEYEAGTAVGYGRTFRTTRKTKIANIPAGYSDGVSRKLSNKGAFVIKGQLAPIIGNVCMDCTMADVTDIIPSVEVGDEAAIFDNVNMTVERIAELCGTIHYEILTNIKEKADKIEVY